MPEIFHELPSQEISKGTSPDSSVAMSPEQYMAQELGEAGVDTPESIKAMQDFSRMVGSLENHRAPATRIMHTNNEVGS